MSRIVSMSDIDAVHSSCGCKTRGSLAVTTAVNIPTDQHDLQMFQEIDELYKLGIDNNPSQVNVVQKNVSEGAISHVQGLFSGKSKPGSPSFNLSVPPSAPTPATPPVTPVVKVEPSLLSLPPTPVVSVPVPAPAPVAVPSPATTTELLKLRNEISVKNSIISQIQSQQKKTESEKTGLRVQVLKFQGDVDKLTREKNGLKIKLTRAIAEKDQIQGQLDAINASQGSTTNAQVTSLQKQLKEARKSVQDLSNKNVEISDKLERVSSLLKKVREKLKLKEDEYNDLNNKFFSVSSKLKELEDTIEQQKATMKRQNEMTRNALEGVRTAKEEKKVLEDRLNRISEELRVTKLNLASATEKDPVTADELAIMIGKNEEQTLNIQKLTKALQDVKSELADKDQQIKLYELEVEQGAEVLQTTRKSLKEQQNKVQKYEAAVEGLSEEIDLMKNQNGALNASLANSIQATNELQDKLDTMHAAMSLSVDTEETPPEDEKTLQMVDAIRTNEFSMDYIMDDADVDKFSDAVNYLMSSVDQDLSKSLQASLEKKQDLVKAMNVISGYNPEPLEFATNAFNAFMGSAQEMVMFGVKIASLTRLVKVLPELVATMVSQGEYTYFGDVTNRLGNGLALVTMFKTLYKDELFVVLKKQLQKDQESFGAELDDINPDTVPEYESLEENEDEALLPEEGWENEDIDDEDLDEFRDTVPKTTPQRPIVGLGKGKGLRFDDDEDSDEGFDTSNEPSDDEENSTDGASGVTLAQYYKEVYENTIYDKIDEETNTTKEIVPLKTKDGKNDNAEGKLLKFLFGVKGGKNTTNATTVAYLAKALRMIDSTNKKDDDIDEEDAEFLDKKVAGRLQAVVDELKVRASRVKPKISPSVIAKIGSF